MYVRPAPACQLTRRAWQPHPTSVVRAWQSLWSLLEAMSHCADTTVKDLGVDQYLRRVGAVNRERQLHVSGCPLWVELQRDATVDAPLRSFEDVLPPRVWVLPGLLSGFRSVTLPRAEFELVRSVNATIS